MTTTAFLTKEEGETVRILLDYLVTITVIVTLWVIEPLVAVTVIV